MPKIGINDVIVHARSSGTRQRELNTLQALLPLLLKNNCTPRVYLANDIDDGLTTKLLGHEFLAYGTRTPIPSVPTYQRVLKGLRYWPQQINADELDLFHTSYYPTPRSLAPIVLTVNDLRFLHFPETYAKGRFFFLRCVVGYSIRHASHIIAISEDTKRDICHFFGIDSNRVSVAHIPADPEFSVPVSPEKLLETAKTFNLPKRFMLYVGHLEPRKNLNRLVQAYLQARRMAGGDFPDLVILGRKSFGVSELESIVHNAIEKGYIRFTGYIPDQYMVSIYRLAESLTFPSLHEGFGIPLLEAMATDTAILTSNTSALPEVAGNAALYVDPRCIDDIAHGISRLATDVNLRETLITAGRQRLKAFTSERAAQAVFNAYQIVLQQRK